MTDQNSGLIRQNAVPVCNRILICSSCPAISASWSTVYDTMIRKIILDWIVCLCICLYDSRHTRTQGKLFNLLKWKHHSHYRVDYIRHIHLNYAFFFPSVQYWRLVFFLLLVHLFTQRGLVAMKCVPTDSLVCIDVQRNKLD